MTERVIEAIDLTRLALQERAGDNWVVGFSGGKDSTAVLKVLVAAYLKATPRPQQVDIIYCDTGVENPALDAYIKALFLRLEGEFENQQIPFYCHLLQAPVEQRFFVKVVGRGYPTPTNSFRWCTKNLRIRPVANFIEKCTSKSNTVVALGMRQGESQQRDRSLKKDGNAHWQVQHEAKSKYDLFLPVLKLDVAAVWDAIFMLDEPSSIVASDLEQLYRGASGECPIIKAPNAPPCGSGRFGCWTCTVVRKDHSAMKLIDAGYTYLEPYLKLRNWLAEIRNRPDYRWPVRRNGRISPGPFSLKARYEILTRLRALEAETGHIIVDEREEREIRRLWSLDIEREAELNLPPVLEPAE